MSTTISRHFTEAGARRKAAKLELYAQTTRRGRSSGWKHLHYTYRKVRGLLRRYIVVETST